MRSSQLRGQNLTPDLLKRMFKNDIADSLVVPSSKHSSYRKKGKKNVLWNSIPKYDTDNVFGLNQNLNYQTWITL